LGGKGPSPAWPAAAVAGRLQAGWLVGMQLGQPPGAAGRRHIGCRQGRPGPSVPESTHLHLSQFFLFDFVLNEISLSMHTKMIPHDSVA